MIGMVVVVVFLGLVGFVGGVVIVGVFFWLGLLVEYL